MIAKIMFGKPKLAAIAKAVKLVAKHVAKDKSLPKPMRNAAKIVEKLAETGEVIA
jgi:hypothetical protein